VILKRVALAADATEQQARDVLVQIYDGGRVVVCSFQQYAPLIKGRSTEGEMQECPRSSHGQ
jgi:hypothetical protein